MRSHVRNKRVSSGGVGVTLWQFMRLQVTKRKNKCGGTTIRLHVTMKRTRKGEDTIMCPHDTDLT